MSEHLDETYIGDGVYASFDGFSFKLRTRRAHGDDEIFLEPAVLYAFVSFIKSMGIKLERRHD
jgi:hypothetical protein